jgi:hypothetical protein
MKASQYDGTAKSGQKVLKSHNSETVANLTVFTVSVPNYFINNLPEFGHRA